MNPTGTDLAVVKPWASRIQNHLQTGIKSFILAGHDLDAAVEDFKQQDGKHWKHAYSELLAEVKISQQTAHTLRSIARHPILSDPSNYGSLPGSWSTLGELASLPSPELEQRMKAGEITPDLKRYQVREWKQSNHLPASGSSWPSVDMEPVFFNGTILQMPSDLTESEADEINMSICIFEGEWQWQLDTYTQQCEAYFRTKNRQLGPPKGDPVFFNAIQQYYPRKIFAVSYMDKRLHTGRLVVGVLFGDGQGVEP